MFNVDMHTQPQLCLHTHTLPQSPQFHREFYVTFKCWKLPLWQDQGGGNYSANPNCSRFNVDKLAG